MPKTPFSAVCAILSIFTTLIAAPTRASAAEDVATVPARFSAAPLFLGGATHWRVRSLRGARPIQGSEISARFSGGTVSGRAGCNAYNGSYEAGGGVVTIPGVGLTRMRCFSPRGVMEQEQSYVRALQEARTYFLQRNRLFFRNSDGAVVIEFIRSR
ncbi:META domain-containing protein [Polyangium spumosum]|uniref:META domain-containing protein n=1 Tax=Polyangium spumosum TaxID=889282 RepID=A0A6N7Q2V3_9BACT|nr:META domain-containing protein [Polyangium spumosum]MRG97150.1 META domain-containing protein [Polyangium spumosum]